MERRVLGGHAGQRILTDGWVVDWGIGGEGEGRAGKDEGDQFGLLGVALQLLEEEKTSPVTGRSCVAHVLLSS